MEINEILDGLNESASMGSNPVGAYSNPAKGDNWIKTLLLLSVLSNNNMGGSCNCCCEKPKFKKVQQTLYEPVDSCGGANLFGGNNLLMILLLSGMLDR